MSSLPTDLEIRISTEDTPGATRLRYVLHSPSGKVDYTHSELEGKTEIRARPREYQERMLACLEKLGRGLASDGSELVRDEVARELEGIGRELYKELFPRALKVEYEQFRTRVSTLLIVSDEPWIPWELIKPHGKGFDDDFLSCRFELTRWLAGDTTPAKELAAANLLCFEAGRPPGVKPLSHAAKESRLVHELATGRDDIESLIVPDASRDAVVGKLQIGGAGILHFVGHGKFEAGEPNVSRFLLTDGTSFRPRDLSYDVESRIRQDRPLVFFNSCQVAQQGYTLSRLGGWVQRWILDCGCGAFLGPQWSVSDESALLFARSFYKALKEGETIGLAALRARLAVREKNPGDAAWLAYTVYAHPNATLRLGSDAVLARNIEAGRSKQAEMAAPCANTVAVGSELVSKSLTQALFSAASDLASLLNGRHDHEVAKVNLTSLPTALRLFYSLGLSLSLAGLIWCLYQFALAVTDATRDLGTRGAVIGAVGMFIIFIELLLGATVDSLEGRKK